MVTSDVQVEKIATPIARLHICVFFPRTSPPGAWSHLIHNPHPTTTTIPSAAQCCPGPRPSTTATCLPVAALHRSVRSALSLVSFPIGQSWWHHLMVWHICTKWLVFVYLSKYQGVLLWEKWYPWGECKRVITRQTVITLTLHVLVRPLTYALLISNKGWTVLHIDGQTSD